MAETKVAPAEKVQKSKGKSGEIKGRPVKRSYSGLDLARKVSKMFKSEYPEMADAHAMQLAVLLAKAQMKGDLDKG